MKQRVEELIFDYAQAIDSGNLELWPEFFTDTCQYVIIGRDNFERNLPIGVVRCESIGMLRDRVNAIRNASVFAPRYIRHIIGGVRVLEHEGDHLRARSNVAVYHTTESGDTALLMVAEYRDVIIMRNDELKFQEKFVIYDTLRIPDSIVYPI